MSTETTTSLLIDKGEYPLDVDITGLDEQQLEELAAAIYESAGETLLEVRRRAGVPVVSLDGLSVTCGSVTYPPSSGMDELASAAGA